MVIIITGPSHVGKTYLASKLLAKYHYPYYSIDHLKMGLIRSGKTLLTPLDDDKLTSYLWPVVREIIKTAIENDQDLIIEGCYIPFDFRLDFEKEYLKEIRFICLAMSKEYIMNHYDDIIEYSSVVERRMYEEITKEELIKDNEIVIKGFIKEKEEVTIIDDNYLDILR